ncbi:hypothetical protein FNF27_04128 [Cafeteria roenbergensis]|uniref:Uncharacterized protein n=1 Tax=Cafeteria roenbergensis TaxID=33653 RepID=A0A5A8D3X5_CAFRO|nr:hypothetical protein FNF28_07337 [Cafeteria roenbergensis]KAA0151268.1 hypothetical protein FNF29_04743 [Cafeteria roenbergensis]KAA0160173.1 hypothetical protein FNF31_04483 [Cafeteria roenbergensis]KAA0174336.1 hypothetical protein FNF27_04128 [Cafeteria roenbergensis]|eukprot:KAA0151268.1 hypothetical protein FNF29_04743 [Cafeteria roenbergensis]
MDGRPAGFISAPTKPLEVVTDSDVFWTRLGGLGMIVVGLTIFVGGLFFIFGSFLLPPSDNPLLEAVRGNHYMAALLPHMFPVMVVFVITNWLAMKLFRHN